MKTLCLAKYPWNGPSSRYRLYQFLPFLRSAGIEVDVQTLHDDRYLQRRFAGGSAGAGYLAGRVLSRLLKLASVKHHHVLFVQKEIFPHAPGVVEALLERMGTKVVLDLDDAIHLPYRGTRLERKIDRVVSRCDLVLAGNRYLADYARRYNDNVVLFPTVVDTERFVPGNVERSDRPVVGWMGSPATSSYLRDRMPALVAACAEGDFELLVVGDDGVGADGIDVGSRRWDLDAEADDLQAMDIGVMPLARDEWSEGKCALKLLQYMSAGLATISSPTGAVNDIIDHGVNGLIASGDDEWRECTSRLVGDAALRKRMGASARAWVCEHYSLARYGPRLARYLHAVVRGEAVDDES